MVNHVVKYGLIVVACVLPLLIDSSPASAISWEQRESDGRTCRYLVAPHIHVGIGENAVTERVARNLAVRRWSNFTVWEYGRAWGNARLARHKSYNCTKLLGGWHCLFLAQPCRR